MLSIKKLNVIRKKFYDLFFERFKKQEKFKIVGNNRGESFPAKIVLIFSDQIKAKIFIEFMKKANIKSRRGYSILKNIPDNLPITRKVDNCIVELPLECNKERMYYLINKVAEYTES